MKPRKRRRTRFAKSRQGKIARLPLNIREELNRRLLDNQSSSTICEWLNGLPEMVAQCAERGLAPVVRQEVSSWRQGDYQEWLVRNERVHQTQELARFSSELAKSGGSQLSDGASAILAGQILEALEGLALLQREIREFKPAGRRSGLLEVSRVMAQVATALAGVRRGDQAREQIILNRDKYLRVVCGRMLEEGQRQKVEEIANANISYEEKIKAIRAVTFADVDEFVRSGKLAAMLPPRT